MLRKLFLIGLVGAFLAPTNVFAAKGDWSFTPYGGATYIYRDMVNFGSTISTQNIAVTAPFSDGSRTLAGGVLSTAGDLKFEDTHSTPISAGFEAGYFISDTLEIFGGFEYAGCSGCRNGGESFGWPTL